jgi:hypothetical protein
MAEWDGVEERRKEHCAAHPNCVYRLEILEKWQQLIDAKINKFQNLLIANLAGIITLLATTTIGMAVWIVQH